MVMEINETGKNEKPTDLVETASEMSGIVRIQNHNDEIFEQIGQLGFYHMLLIPVVWWCHLCAVVNETYMVFAGAFPVEVCQRLTLANDSTASIVKCVESELFHGIVEEWDLTGSLKFVAPLAATLQLTGTLFGTFLGGVLSDSFGRWPTFFSMAVSRTIFGITCSFMPGYPSFLALRILVGLTNGAYFSVGYVYMMEAVGKDHRLLIQAGGDAVLSLGFCWTALLAFLTGNWKWLGIVGNLAIIPALLVFLILEESPRWLVQKGKIQRANTVAIAMAKWNRYQEVRLFLDPKSAISENSGTAPPFKLFGKGRTAISLALVTFSFFVTGLVGYGIIFNTDNLTGNIFLNFAILGFVNLVPLAIIIFAEWRWGGVRRRWTHQICLAGVALCFLAVILQMVLDQEGKYRILVNVASFLGSAFSVPLWTVCALYSAELFPTLIRTVAIGVGNAGARLGGILAPIIVQYLITFWHPIPFIVFGALAALNLIIALALLPETKGLTLPDDAEPPQNSYERL